VTIEEAYTRLPKRRQRPLFNPWEVWDLETLCDSSLIYFRKEEAK
jgi:hypothetical protein